MIEKLFDLMTSAATSLPLHVVLAGVVLLLLYGVAAFLTRPFRRAHGITIDRPATAGYLLQAGIGYLMVPVTVWASGQLIALVGHGKFWQDFGLVWAHVWFILILLRAAELAVAIVYRLAGRPFPLPDLLRQTLWFLVTGLTALIVVRHDLHGVDIKLLLVAAALIVAAIGFALQEQARNLFAGIALQANRALLPGQHVRIGKLEGMLVQKNWRETLLRTNDQRSFHVPNSRLADSVIENFDTPDRIRRHSLRFVLSFVDSPADAEEALLRATDGIPGILAGEEWQPVVHLTRYLDYGIEYRLRFWTEGMYHRRDEINSIVQRRAWFLFRRHGVEIPFPVSDKVLKDLVDVISIQREKPAEEERIAEWDGALSRSPFVVEIRERSSEGVAREVCSALSHAALEEWFDRDEEIVREGSPDRHIYVILAGRAEASQRGDGNRPTALAELSEGEIIGEMSLLLGVPRVATIRAVTVVRALRIEEAAFEHLLGKTEFSEVLRTLALRRWEMNRGLVGAAPPASSPDDGASLSALHRFRQAVWRGILILIDGGGPGR